MLEARVAGWDGWVRFLVEFATYPTDREYSQLIRGVLLNQAAKGEPPEAVVFVLHPKGDKQLPSELQVTSPLGGTTVAVQRRVVELWRIPAAELRAFDDPGLIPWLPLTDFKEDPRELLDDCRERIERLAPETEQESMLAATRTFASLRFRDESLLNRLMWRRAMLDIPYLSEMREVFKEDLRSDLKKELRPELREELRPEIKEELRGEVKEEVRAEAEVKSLRNLILNGLKGRFGELPRPVIDSIQSASDAAWLTRLVPYVWTSGSFEEFAAEMK